MEDKKKKKTNTKPNHICVYIFLSSEKFLTYSFIHWLSTLGEQNCYCTMFLVCKLFLPLKIFQLEIFLFVMFVMEASKPKGLFVFPFIFISWRLMTLQYCSGFCHILTWISHRFTCVPHPHSSSHLPLYPIPLGLPSAPGPNTCLTIQPGLVICFTIDNIHVSMLFSRNIPPSPWPPKSKSLFCTLCFLYSHVIWPKLNLS